MTVENQDYKLKILEYAINQCIDSLLPNSSEDALSIILYQSNEIVWRVATEIYTKSGHKIDFLFILDILNIRIEPLQNKIAEEERIRKNREAEEARIRAELEAQRLAKEIEEERLRKIREAEAAKIRAEEARIRKEREAEEQKKLQELKQACLNIEIDSSQELKIIKNQIITRVKDVIVELLEVEEEDITLEVNFTNDLGADELEEIELIMAIEEEFDFDIEFPEPIPWGRYSSLSDIDCDTVGKLITFVMQKLD